MNTHPFEHSSSQSLEHSDVWSSNEAGYKIDLTDPTDSTWLLADNNYPSGILSSIGGKL